MSDSQTIVPLESANPLELLTGRVTQLSFGDEVTSVQVLDQPDYGRVTVNPDGSLAFVMSETDFLGRVSFTSEVTLQDGSTKTVTTEVDLSHGGQASGWGLGDFYQLATDGNDASIIEYGDNHRAIYVSGSESALSLEDIAAREGVAVSALTEKWFRAHTEYGSTQELALDETAGMRMWKATATEEAHSNWLLFEKGYSYGSAVDLTNVNGESALHPVLISSYGDEGEAVLTSGIKSTKSNTSNIVIRDLTLQHETTLLSGKNVLIEGVTASQTLNLQNMDGLTVRNSSSIDAYRAESLRENGVWEQSADRVSGIFVKNSDGVLIENNLFDHAGWGEGYDYNLSENSAQPPSFYSHNVYIQRDNTDVSFRDNISMRGASFGAQIRSGGFIEDNVFIDNNAGVNFFGGDLDTATGLRPGNYTLFTGNLVTSAGYKTVSQNQGALSMGVNHGGFLSSMIDNIVAHLADPDNPQELAQKVIAHDASYGNEAYYDDTIIYNWVGSKGTTKSDLKNPDTNVEGLDSAILDQTTIQRFTAQLLGQDKATIGDLADFLRAQAAGELDHVADADLILAFFQEGFGLAADLDSAAGAQRFVPNALGDGMRWDNRLNWDKGYVPTQGQDIDLGSNRVHYAGAGTNEIGDLDLGEGGSLITGAGKLTVSGALSVGETGGTIEIGNSGQIWLAGYSDGDRLSLDISGGRLANQGAVTGLIDMSVTGGQVMLVAGNGRFDLSSGSRIEIRGDEAKVGFDGTGGATASLQIGAGATLAFIADATGISTIGEFRSGVYGDTPSDSLSSITLGGMLSLDLSDLGAGVTGLTLIAADEITGDFDEVSVTGLGSGRNATLLVDYDSDTVTISLSAGSGEIIRETSGEGGHQEIIELPDEGGETGPVTDPDLGDVTAPVLPEDGADQDIVNPVTPPDSQTPDEHPTGMSEIALPEDSEGVSHIFADGRERITWFEDGLRSTRVERDLLDRKNWVEWRAGFDETGAISQKTRVFDDGREMQTEYENGIRISESRWDTKDVRHWDSWTRSFDAKGKITENLQQMDDGREIATHYENGRKAMVLSSDLEDSFIWSSTGRSFDSHGDLVTEVKILDDGGIRINDGDETHHVASYEDLSLFQKALVDQFDFV